MNIAGFVPAFFIIHTISDLNSIKSYPSPLNIGTELSYFPNLHK